MSSQTSLQIMPTYCSGMVTFYADIVAISKQNKIIIFDNNWWFNIMSMYDAIYRLHWIINALIILAVCVCVRLQLNLTRLSSSQIKTDRFKNSPYSMLTCMRIRKINVHAKAGDMEVRRFSKSFPTLLVYI